MMAFPTKVINGTVTPPWNLTRTEQLIMSGLSIGIGYLSIILSTLFLYGIYKKGETKSREIGLIGLCSASILYSLTTATKSVISISTDDYSCAIEPYVMTFAMLAQYMCNVRLTLTLLDQLTSPMLTIKDNPLEIVCHIIGIWTFAIIITCVFTLVPAPRTMVEPMYNSTYCFFSYDTQVANLVIPVTFMICTTFVAILYVYTYLKIKNDFMDSQTIMAGDTSHGRLLFLFKVKSLSYVMIQIIGWMPYIIAVYYQNGNTISYQKPSYIYDNTEFVYQPVYITSGVPMPLSVLVIITTNLVGILIALIYGYNNVQYRTIMYCGFFGSEISKISITPSGGSRNRSSSGEIKEYKVDMERKAVSSGYKKKRITFNNNEIRGDIDENGTYILLNLNGSNLISDSYIIEYAKTYARKQACVENINFLVEVAEYKKGYNEQSGWIKGKGIADKYIESELINIDAKLREKLETFFSRVRKLKGFEFDEVIKEVNGMLRQVADAITKSEDAPIIAKHYIEVEEAENRTLKQAIRDKIQAEF